MKTTKNYLGAGMYEIVIPFGEGLDREGELFDDCPMCQDLKRRIESGETIKSEWEDFEEKN